MRKLIAFLFLMLIIGCNQNNPIEVISDNSVNPNEDDFHFSNVTGVFKEGYVEGLGKITYEKTGSLNLFQGDIAIPDSLIYDEPPPATRSTGIVNTFKRWPNNTIYYAIDPNLPNPQRVYDAMDHWETNTNISFVPRTNQRNYVWIYRDIKRNHSYVGMNGGAQPIGLKDNASTGVIIHEIGHTVGLLHEQSRVDRDKYVIIHEENMAIHPSNWYKYTQLGVAGFDAGPFDFLSVMIYGSWDGSKINGPAVMTKLDGSTFHSTDILSAIDIKSINIMYPPLWRQRGSGGRDIGVGGNNSVYVIGGTYVGSGNYAIYRWNGGSSWSKLPGGGVRIDVDQNGKPWVVNSKGNIFRWSGSKWIQVAGGARDIGIGPNGYVYIIGMNYVGSGNYGIYRWNGGNSWTQFPGGGVRIDVDHMGYPWIVNSHGNIYKWRRTRWIQEQGGATDITISKQRTIHIIGKGILKWGRYGYNREIWEWNGKGWTSQYGGGVNISAGETHLWVTNCYGGIYQRALN